MKCFFGMWINIKVFYKLILSFWVCVTRHAQSTQNKKFAYLCNISRKTWGMKWFFCLQINTKVFYKVILSFQACVTKLAQSIQNNKFAVSFQYLKENGNNEVDFLLADKHQRFLQTDTIKDKEVSGEVEFLHADKHQSFLQVDFNTLSIKVFYKVILSLLMGMIKHSQSTQSNKFAISLQCLKRKLGMEFIFCSLYAVCIIVFDGSGQTCPKYPK